MNFEPELKKHIPEFLKSYHITLDEKESDKLVEKLTFHIYNLIVNICSLLSTISIIYSPKHRTIEPKHVDLLLQYIKQECYPKTSSQSGGSYVIDSEYFGTETGAYQDQVKSTKVGNIDFEKLIARPAMEVQMGGRSDNKLYGVSLKKIIKLFNVKVSDYTLTVVTNIIKMHIDCLVADLKDRKVLTLKHLEKTIKLSRHAVFT